MRSTHHFLCLALLAPGAAAVSFACGGKTEPIDLRGGSSGGGGHGVPPGSGGGGGGGGSSGGVSPGSCPSYCTYDTEIGMCACSSVGPSDCPPSAPTPGMPCTFQESLCLYPGCACSCGTAEVWSCNAECNGGGGAAFDAGLLGD